MYRPMLAGQDAPGEARVGPRKGEQVQGANAEVASPPLQVELQIVWLVAL